MSNEAIVPLVGWKTDLVREHEPLGKSKRQPLFWLWGGQVSKSFMLDRYFTPNDSTRLNKYIKIHGKDTAKVLEARRTKMRKRKRVRLALLWLSDKHGLSYTTLSKRYDAGDRGDKLIRELKRKRK